MIILALLVSYTLPLVIYFWLRSLKPTPEYRRTCRTLLLRGLLVVLGVCLFSATASLLWNLSGAKKISPLLNAAFRTFVVASLSEETVKLYMAFRKVKKSGEPISWFDITIYVTILGISFTLIEDFVYLFESSIGHVLVRGLMPLHVYYSMMMGWYVGKSLYTGKKRYAVIGFVVPWFLHGLYDFSIAEEFLALNDNLVFVPFLVIFVSMIIGIRMIIKILKAKKDERFLAPLFGEK